MSDVPAAAAPRLIGKRFSKHDFYRYCRIVHGWLSALAFVALCFFSFTGLLLNHPEWFTESAPVALKEKFELSEREVERIRDAEEPEEEVVKIAAGKIALRGEMTGGNTVGAEVFVRMQGVRGLSDLRANLRRGTLEVVIEPTPSLSVFNELHRAERAGKTWRMVVDVIATVLIVLSIVGYLIFL